MLPCIATVVHRIARDTYAWDNWAWGQGWGNGGVEEVFGVSATVKASGEAITIPNAGHELVMHRS